MKLIRIDVLYNLKVIKDMRRIWVILILGAYSCTESNESKVQKFLIKGNNEINNKNFDQGIAYYKEAVRIDPCFTEGLNNLGTAYFKQQHFEQAANRYQEAINCDPDFLPAYYNRANTFYELKEYFNALKDLDHIETIQPDTAITSFIRGLVQTKLRNFDLAKTAFKKAFDLDSTNVEYLVNLANVKFYLKDYENAKSDLYKAIELNQFEANIYNTLSMIATDENNLEEAMKQVNKAISLSPEEPYFVNNRGYIFLIQNELEKAEADINNSLSADPENGWAYRNKGIYYLMKQDFENAERLLKQANDMDSFIDKLHFYLGMAYLKTGKQALACEQFDLSEEAGDNMVTVSLLKMCR